jgi:hypothetical protein
MEEISPGDCYLLRKAQMDVDRKALDSQRSQQELERMVLELEHKYDLLSDGKSIDPRTATIRGTLSSHRSNGKGSLELLPVGSLDDKTASSE